MNIGYRIWDFVSSELEAIDLKKMITMIAKWEG